MLKKVTGKSDLIERPLSHRGGIRKSTVDQTRKIKRTSKIGDHKAEDDTFRSMSSDEHANAANIVSPRGIILRVADLESSPNNLSKQNTQ